MHIDARKIDNNSLIEGDICIIGAGAAGISIALDWKKTGYKVILLEGGGFDYDPKLQELYKGKNIGQKYLPLDSIRLHNFGGTTGLWGGYCSPMDEIDFMKRDWVEYSGWPISLKDLKEYYIKSKDLLDLHSVNYESEYWKSIDSNMNSLPFEKDVVFDKIWQFSPPTRFGTKYKEEIINSKNINLYTYANVVNINAHENLSSIESLDITNHEGKNHKVKAKHYILACGAIQNARLLLCSNKQNVKGLGNDNDIVGRFFMEHIEVSSAEMWLDNIYPMDFYLLNFGKTKARAELAISGRDQRKHKILNGTASLRPLKSVMTQSGINERWKDGNPNLNKSEKSIIERFSRKLDKIRNSSIDHIDQAYGLHTRIEQAPNPLSRIVLNDERDELGMSRVNLDWKLLPIDKKSVRGLYEIIGNQIGLSDFGRIRLNEFLRDQDNTTWPENTSGGFHHMGTTRMSNDPKNGVVDSNCRVHGINNLHVAGSSCFTTSGAVNPTFTLIALSLRLSDHLKNNINIRI